MTHHDLVDVQPWFDDDESARWLGGREWPSEMLRLQTVVVGESSDGVTTTERSAFVAVDGDGVPIGLIDLEFYDNGTGSAALVVAPRARRHSVGREILAAVERVCLVRHINEIVGHVECGNVPSIRCLQAAGYTLSESVDADGLIAVSKRLAGSRVASAHLHF